ncbi:MAG: thioredoxin [Lentimicrobiaceae bacterium]|jgi:thioredoxin|nr:thioredoxin [Lentimicrobiaceae bacterium]
MNKQMNQFLSIFLGSILFLISCSNSDNQQVKVQTNKKSTQIFQDSEAIEKLNYDAFISKIWNFEADPNDFKYKGELPAIIDFYADWCGPCKMIAPYMEKFAKEYDGRLKVYKIDVDKEKKLANAFQIRSIPVVMFIPVGKQPMLQPGALSEVQYRQIIEENLLNRN